MPYVYSTITASQAYTLYGKSENAAIAPMQRVCVIEGGSGVADKHFITPRGVATFVTDAQLEMLNKCPAYLRHKKAGYITEDKAQVNVEQRAASMQEKDGSAPLTPKDFPEANQPVVNSKRTRKNKA